MAYIIKHGRFGRGRKLVKVVVQDLVLAFIYYDAILAILFVQTSFYPIFEGSINPFKKRLSTEQSQKVENSIEHETVLGTCVHPYF